MVYFQSFCTKRFLMYDAINIENVLMRNDCWESFFKRVTAPFSLPFIDEQPSVVNPHSLFSDMSEISQKKA